MRPRGAIVRALRSHTRHLASLARVLQHVGRPAKTIHRLDYCNDQPFRRRILTHLNRGESRHALARDVCHGHRAASSASATAKAKKNSSACFALTRRSGSAGDGDGERWRDAAANSPPLYCAR